jgi:hypothetical protein
LSEQELRAEHALFNSSRVEVALEERKSGTAQEMMKVWNETLCRDDALTKGLARYLVACFQRKFERSLDKWREYVTALRGSKYVVGDLLKRLGSHLLKWALSFKVINRIFEGGFGVIMPRSWKQADCSAEEHIESLSESEACKEVRRAAMARYGKLTYMVWFPHVELEDVGGEIRIHGRPFLTDYVKNGFLFDDDRCIAAPRVFPELLPK